MAYTTIDDGSEYFHIQLYTGNGSTQSITNDANAGDFKPDWLWIKRRDDSDNHHLFDTSRGITKELNTNGQGGEGSGTNLVTASNTDGFSLGNNGGTNGSSETYAAWQWKANGGSTSSNTDGSITSTVQASTASGFSIVTYTGNGSDNATVGHGLGEKPKIIIPKRRDGNGHWLINNWVSEQDYAQKLKWNDTEAQTSSDNFIKDASSTTFTLGTDVDVNANSGTYVCYCFAEKQGFSKFGQYTGNGSTNGPFIFTGFTPNFFFVKRWDGTAGWHLYDGQRETDNDGTRPTFKIHNEEGEFNKDIDFLSNGLKFRDTTSDANTAGGAYIWAAFARHPFVSSEGVPITAL